MSPAGRRWRFRHLRFAQLLVMIGVLGGPLMLAGCGGSGAALSSVSSVCRPGAVRAAAARVSGVPAGAWRVSGTRSDRFTAYCRLSARGIRLRVTVDTAAQAFWRLQRTEAEYAQAFATLGKPLDAPAHIGGLGLNADWLPVEGQVMASDGRRLITTAITWPHVGRARRQALAVAVTRPFLGRSVPPPPQL